MELFSEWLHLLESMSVYVQNYDFQDDVNDFNDLCEYLKRKVAYPIFDRLNPEAQQAIREAGSASHGIIVPDGDYYSDGKEIMNIYTAGWPEPDKLVQGVKYYLDEMGAKYGPFKYEQSGMYESPVVRIPILQWHKTRNTPPLLNLSNGNARLIFGELLELPGHEDGGYSNISAADLYRKIEELEREKIDIHARDPYSQQRGGVSMYHGGLNSEDIMARLEQLKNICLWAIKNGYDTLYVA